MINTYGCLRIDEKGILWWRKQITTYNHEWRYLNDFIRHCQKCSRKEILFGKSKDKNEGLVLEEWRPLA